MPTAKTSIPALKLPLQRARAHWHRLQGLTDPSKSSLDELVAETGWVRALGGGDVYLATRARRPGMRRAELDGAVAEGRLRVSPAVRGCIYLVPRVHAALALRTAEASWRKRAEGDLDKAGSSWKEVETVADAAWEALGQPLGTDALRKALPAAAVRSFGERGKKVGLSSPLPVALRQLEFAGKIERRLEDGRLDTERYLWRRAAVSPFEGAKVPADATARLAALAEIFFAHAGPATLKDFAEWTAAGVREAETATKQAPLAPVSVEGYAPHALVLERHLPALRGDAAPESTVRMLSFEDNYLTGHGVAPLTDRAHHRRRCDVWGSSKPSTLGEARHLAARTLVIDGVVAGYWELDPDAGRVVFATFEPLPSKRRKELEALAGDLTAFLRDEIGHGRSFSLDTDDAVRDRAGRVRAMARKPAAARK